MSHDLIPDPHEPHRRAIDPRTGRLAHGVFIGPARGPGDPPPTAAEVEAMVRPENHIGYTSTRFDDYLDLLRTTHPQEDPQP